MNPARDLRGANGRPKKLWGSALVFFPQRRPNVEALVSAQDSLSERQRWPFTNQWRDCLHEDGDHRDIQGKAHEDEHDPEDIPDHAVCRFLEGSNQWETRRIKANEIDLLAFSH